MKNCVKNGVPRLMGEYVDSDAKGIYYVEVNIFIHFKSTKTSFSKVT